MELPRLAAKQKRYRDILAFSNEETLDPSLKPPLLQTLANYRSALAQCWRQGNITSQDLLTLDSIERELEKLHNDARLRTAHK